MKPSSLDPHAPWIEVQIRDGVPMKRIQQELKGSRNCPVALETLRKWVVRQTQGGCLKGVRLKRGRPKKDPKGIPPFIPANTAADPKPIQVPLFFYALLHPVVLENYAHDALRELGIESQSQPSFLAWAGKIGRSRVEALSDLDFCLLAILSRNLGPIPYAANKEEICVWVQEFLLEAAKLRMVIRQAVGLNN
ncbi:MAG: hypothetical protein WCH98_02180 [Verrucomicrobiota bacterium]